MDHSSSTSARSIHYNIGSYYPSVNVFPRTAFRGEVLRVGMQAPDFSLESIDGRSIVLAELIEHGNVALIFGSYSAYPVVAELPLIERIHRTGGPGTSIIFIYTREIHPGELIGAEPVRIPAHASLNEKLEAARVMRDQLGLSMTICVDDLDGTTHDAYGGLPFFQIVVAADGIVVHRSEWANARQLQAVLENQSLHDKAGELGRKPLISYSETLWKTFGSVIPKAGEIKAPPQ